MRCSEPGWLVGGEGGCLQPEGRRGLLARQRLFLQLLVAAVVRDCDTAAVADDGGLDGSSLVRRNRSKIIYLFKAGFQLLQKRPQLKFNFLQNLTIYVYIYTYDLK